MLHNLILLLGGASIVLADDAQVRGTELELGRVAQVRCDDAALAARLEHFSLGWTPAPRYSRLLQRWELERDLKNAFPDVEFTVSGSERCRVAPQTEVVRGEALLQKAKRELETLFQGRDARLRPDTNVIDIEVPAATTGMELRAALQRRELRGGAWSVPVQIWIDGGVYQTAWIGLNVELWADVPVLVRDVARGELLAPEMVESRHVQLDASNALGGPASPLVGDALAGAVANRDLARGTVVTDQDVRRARMVSRGEVVTIEVHKGAVVARATFTCQQDGALGDKVKVVNADKSRELTVEVCGRATCRITL